LRCLWMLYESTSIVIIITVGAHQTIDGGCDDGGDEARVGTSVRVGGGNARAGGRFVGFLYVCLDMIILAIDTGTSDWYSAGRGVSKAGPPLLLRVGCQGWLGAWTRFCCIPTPLPLLSLCTMVNETGSETAGRPSHVRSPQAHDDRRCRGSSCRSPDFPST